MEILEWAKRARGLTYGTSHWQSHFYILSKSSPTARLSTQSGP
jgi:hypothetical protein